MTLPCSLKSPTIIEDDPTKAWFVLMSFDSQTGRKICGWRCLWRRSAKHTRFQNGWWSGWTGIWWMVGRTLFADFHTHRLDIRTDQMIFDIMACKIWRTTFVHRMLANGEPPMMVEEPEQLENEMGSDEKPEFEVEFTFV